MALVQSILVKPKAGFHMCFRKQLFWKRRKNQKIFVVEFTTKRDLDCCFTRKFSNLLNAASINNCCFNQSCVCRTTLPVGWSQKSECGYYFQESVTHWGSVLSSESEGYQLQSDFSGQPGIGIHSRDNAFRELSSFQELSSNQHRVSETLNGSKVAQGQPNN